MAGAQKQTLDSEILPIWPYCGPSGSDPVMGQLPIKNPAKKLAYDACCLQESAVRDLSFSM
jgi:hypothetical protein